jgi:hypothetical protein
MLFLLWNAYKLILFRQTSALIVHDQLTFLRLFKNFNYQAGSLGFPLFMCFVSIKFYISSLKSTHLHMLILLVPKFLSYLKKKKTIFYFSFLSLILNCMSFINSSKYTRVIFGEHAENLSCQGIKCFLEMSVFFLNKTLIMVGGSRLSSEALLRPSCQLVISLHNPHPLLFFC